MSPPSFVRITFLAGLIGQTFIEAVRASAPTYSAYYLPYDAPKQSEPGQFGTNQCGNTSSQDSVCQNAYLNAVDDFCLWAPPSDKSSYGDSSIANTERLEVSWCLRSGYGTRVMPPDTITGAHWVQTPNYVQITGTGSLTNLLIPKGDAGGELDPHGYDGLGNPIGGLVFGDSFGGVLRQYHEWTNFMGASQFCFRACIDEAQNPHNPNPYNAKQYCGHIWDTLGCDWNMPGDYSEGFTSCVGDSTDPMGIYVDNGVTTTFHQGDPVTPTAHPAAPSSMCTTYAALTNAGSPAATPTASFLPGSVSASLSRASTASTATASPTTKSSSTGTITTSFITVPPPGATKSTGTGSGTSAAPASTKSSGASTVRTDSLFPRELIGITLGVILGFGAVIAI